MIFISINVEVKLESIAFEEKNQMLITIIYIYTYQILEYLRFYKRSYKNVVKLIRKEPND